LVKFVADAAGVELQYTSDRPGNGWVWRELRDHGGVTISRMFTFEPGDLVVDPGKREEESDYDDFVYRFRFAARRGDYLAIPGRIFDIPNPVMIAAAGVRLERKTFADERNISVLGAIADLLAPDQPIIIGGPRPDAIPVPDYEALLRKFPNTGEMNRYAAARVATIVGDYIQPLMDAREQYERYLTRRRSSVPDRPLDQLEVMRPRSISTSISATSPNALGNCQSGRSAVAQLLSTAEPKGDLASSRSTLDIRRYSRSPFVRTFPPERFRQLRSTELPLPMDAGYQSPGDDLTLPSGELAGRPVAAEKCNADDFACAVLHRIRSLEGVEVGLGEPRRYGVHRDFFHFQLDRHGKRQGIQGRF
jgi:hypothetical protein